MTIKLSEVIDAIGDRNVTIQYLHQALSSAKMKGKRGREYTEITFGTKAATVGELGLFSSPGMSGKGPPTKLGIIVWVEEDRWNNAIESIKADQQSASLDSWRPIETAPKDGTLVDLWLQGPRNQGSRAADCWFYRGQWWQNFGGDGPSTPQIYTDDQPTYWMPLPAAPVEASQS